MEIVEIKKSDVLNAHRSTDSNGKKLLENLVPKLFGDITERIGSFEDICSEAGKDPAKYHVTDDMDDEERAAIYFKKWRLIAKVLNQGKELDLHDDSTKKWTPVLRYTKTGFGFADSGYGFSGTDAGVAVRFASEKLSDFAGKTFTQECNDYYNSK